MIEDFNVLQHELVPEHHLLSEKDADKVLGELRVTRDQFPKIRLSDPAIQVLDELEGPIEEGRIVKIVRNSPTAGVAVCYRLVIRG